MNKLFHRIIQLLSEVEVNLDNKLKNPVTDRDIKLSTALSYDPKHPARIKAEKLIGGDTTTQETELDKYISSKMTPDESGEIHIKNDDFDVKIDTFGDSYTLNWINVKSKNVKGTELFKSILHGLKKLGDRPIHAYGIRGTDIIKGEDGKNKIINVNGYYTVLRWGFFPDKGVKYINKTLKTNYPTMEDAYKDPTFWENWKENGKEFTGVFDMNKNSTSWKVLNREL